MIEKTRNNETTKAGFQAIIARKEKHDNITDFVINADTVPWGLLEKHECEWYLLIITL